MYLRVDSTDNIYKTNSSTKKQQARNKQRIKQEIEPKQSNAVQ